MMQYLMAGQSMLSSIQGYQAEKAQYKASMAWQKYSNTMIRLSDSINQNAITTNSIFAQDQSIFEEQQIQEGSIGALAQAEVGAAAAGVKGRSVNQSMLDIKRNAANRENERVINLRNQFIAFDQQRLQSRFSAEQSQDRSYLPKPSLASALLNGASKAAGAYGKGGGSTPSFGEMRAGVSSYLSGTGYGTGRDVYRSVNSSRNSDIF